MTTQALSPRILKLRQREDQLAAVQEDAARQLQQRKADLPTTAEIGEYVADCREFLAEGRIPERKPERKELNRNFIELIEVVDRDAVSTYTIPMPSDAVTKEQTPVLDFVQSGPLIRSSALDTTRSRMWTATGSVDQITCIG